MAEQMIDLPNSEIRLIEQELKSCVDGQSVDTMLSDNDLSIFNSATDSKPIDMGFELDITPLENERAFFEMPLDLSFNQHELVTVPSGDLDLNIDFPEPMNLDIQDSTSTSALSPQSSCSDDSGNSSDSQSDGQKPFAERSRPAFYKTMTEQERKLVEAEGFTFPDSGVLTKEEEKRLKAIRRKIKNKMSAQDSRKRKKEYVQGLEERVKKTTNDNQRLTTRVSSLEQENRSLAMKLRQMQARLAQLTRSGAVGATTALMIVSLCFSLFTAPGSGIAGSMSSQTPSFNQRTLKQLDQPEVTRWTQEFLSKMRQPRQPEGLDGVTFGMEDLFVTDVRTNSSEDLSPQNLDDEEEEDCQDLELCDNQSLSRSKRKAEVDFDGEDFITSSVFLNSKEAAQEARRMVVVAS